LLGWAAPGCSGSDETTPPSSTEGGAAGAGGIAGSGGESGGGAATGGGGATGGSSASDIPPVSAATWNLHNFSRYGPNEWRLDDIAAMIETLDVDVLAVQEIKVAEGTEGDPPQAWDALLDELEGYDGVHNPWQSYDTCVGLLTKSATTTVLDWTTLFPNNSWAFPRPPLEATVRVDKGEQSIELRVIVLHLKAFADSVDRRRAACQKLDEYLREEPAPEVLIIGDLNDDPYDPPADNSFVDTFLDAEPDYHFITHSLPPESVTSVSWYHWVGNEKITGEFLDHAIATGSLLDRFSTATPTIVSVPESQYDDWEDTHSDHFPVVVDFVP